MTDFGQQLFDKRFSDLFNTYFPHLSICAEFTHLNPTNSPHRSRIWASAATLDNLSLSGESRHHLVGSEHIQPLGFSSRGYHGGGPTMSSVQPYGEESRP